MRFPGDMAGRMAGAIVAVVLAASPGAAGADGGLPPLLPEAADEAAVKAIDGPLESDGSASGGVPAEPSAENETTVVDANAPDSGGVDDSEVSPVPASRLLRALAQGPMPATLAPETLVPEHAAPDAGG